MLKKIPHFGHVLTDHKGLPRYWAAAWMLLIGGSLAESTLKRRLSHIEAFYIHSESGRQPGQLDDALAKQDFRVIEELLESYFIIIRNVPVPKPTSEQRWRDAVSFVRDISERLTRTIDSSNRLSDIRIRLERLDRLYGQLHTSRKKNPSFIRSLPVVVLSELFDLIIPASEANPFKSEKTQWRVYCAFLLLFNQGLRRGEALTLRADFVKTERTPAGRRYWLNVQSNEIDDDPRHSTPSIKTAASIRQIPISPTTAQVFYTYLENYRGVQNHPYFLSSERNQPLSAEGMNHFFKILTKALSPESLKILRDRTGMTTISPHDLRHTSAVVRMKQLLAHGDSMPESLQKMRSFFGWSRISSMPQLYAKAAFEERLAVVWNDTFDDRVAMIASLPK